jgi:hypothetical protein
VVGEAALVEGLQDLEQVGFDAGEKRVGGLVEQLDRGHVGLEGLVVDELLDGLVGGAEQVGHLDVVVAPEVAYAVAAVEGAADDVVERQAGFAVADDERHVRVEVGLGLVGEHG